MKKFLELPISNFNLSIKAAIDAILFENINEFLYEIRRSKIDIVLENRFKAKIYDYFEDNLNDVFHKTTNYTFDIGMFLNASIKCTDYSSVYFNFEIQLIEAPASASYDGQINKKPTMYTETFRYEYHFNR